MKDMEDVEIEVGDTLVYASQGYGHSIHLTKAEVTAVREDSVTVKRLLTDRIMYSENRKVSIAMPSRCRIVQKVIKP